MKTLAPLLILSLLLLTCQLTGTTTPASPPTATATATPVPPTATATASSEPRPTDTPTSTPRPSATPVPPAPTSSKPSAGPRPVGTPVPVPSLPPSPEGYILGEERWIDSYLVQLFRRPDADATFSYDNIVTISRDGVILAQVEEVFALDDLTGTDITGEGHPDVIIETFTGGAHCCFSTILYDLGPELTKVMELPFSNCGGVFEDLDGDGVYEFLTCDDSFAYAYCPYAASPLVRVVMRYKEGYGYVPAGPHFAYLYADDIAQHTRLAEAGSPGEQGEWDGSPKCSVLPLMLDYLYSGQPERAWEVCDEFYDWHDKLLFWAEVLDAVENSPLYVAGGPVPDVPLPAHYFLYPMTSCGADWAYIALLTEGQSLTCSSSTPRWDVFTFRSHLAHTPLLASGENLKWLPEGCTSDCRLMVEDSMLKTVGEIRFEGGAVYRASLDGIESGRWWLRGDLTWEQK